jgi:hypothetical protein
MFWALFIGVALVVGIALVLAQRQPADRDLIGDDPGTTQGYAQARPLSEAEQELYWRLVEALPECVVLSQVSFRSFLRPDQTKAANPRTRAIYFRMAQQSIDFLVCLKDFTVVATVELDESRDGTRRDEMRDELLKAAGITPLHIRAGEIPSAEALRGMFV